MQQRTVHQIERDLAEAQAGLAEDELRLAQLRPQRDAAQEREDALRVPYDAATTEWLDAGVILRQAHYRAGAGDLHPMTREESREAEQSREARHEAQGRRAQAEDDLQEAIRRRGALDERVTFRIAHAQSMRRRIDQYEAELAAARQRPVPPPPPRPSWLGHLRRQPHGGG